jgi:clan AA aspartic protease
MTGVITADREAVLQVLVRGPDGQETSIEAVVDTGFNGFLTLASAIVAALGLTYHSEALATLADGSTVSLSKYLGTVLWHGQEREAIVLQADGGSLVGMSLLYESRVILDVIDGGSVLIEPLT